MGCDIHTFIEFKEKPEQKEWSSFGGQLRPGRDYNIFSEMAGARLGGSSANFIKPRGMPDDIGWECRDDYHYYITEEKSEDHEVNAETAARWVESGSSRYIMRDDRPVWVTDPDAHSESWLTLEEFKAALGRLQYKPGLRYLAMVAAMESFEANGAQTRIVFYFDN